MTNKVAPATTPEGSLLDSYRVEGGYVDCFSIDLPNAVTLSELIVAFYTSSVFRPERWLLGALLRKRADNNDVARLAAGETGRFSAWTVEARRNDEILLCDFRGQTRSWLMVRPMERGTRLHFGSAVVPAKSRVDRLVFGALLGFHRAYSRVLLRGAVRQL
ncbi:MAG: hypothetical protein ACKOPG_09145 [Novosphingobium sp.]